MNIKASKNLLLFYPIRTFTNWTKFLYKSFFIFKFKLNIDNLKKQHIFISDIIKKEKILLNLKHQITVKKRSEINKSNKKPRQQKGLGLARAGSFKSPLWRGGGVIFGPKAKKVNFKIQTKQIKLSKEILLFNKRQNLLIINSKLIFPIYIYNFKTYLNFQLQKCGINSLSKILIINTTNLNILNYFKNIPIKIVNIFHLLSSDLLFNDYICIFI
uniref:Large ribosomal subunit protein uL4c n=1 Tax=Nephromyces sp. ex Molgula occidentalis TaxID=2544991 RepID=A0A5C1H8G7_9APIC|nr:50S ribosomal protein L4 [Nephromyces sp. ex Molgula occidentalis]